jgi:hypothetical protein
MSQEVTCPRCEYDLSSTASWTQACPLEGVCSECGTCFRWSDLLAASTPPPDWSPESPRRWFVLSSLHAAALACRAGALWKAVSIRHNVRPARLLSHAALWGICAHFALVSLVLLNWRVTAYRPYLGREWATIVVSPYNEPIWLTSIGPVSWFQAPLLLTVAPMLAMGVWLVAVCNLAGKCHLRWAHGLRVAGYGLPVAIGWACVVFVLVVLASLSQRVMALSSSESFLLMGLIVVLSQAWLALWAWCFARSYAGLSRRQAAVAMAIGCLIHVIFVVVMFAGLEIMSVANYNPDRF